MTYRPRRVQRQRTKGWRAPLCGCGCGCGEPARYVGRGTRWGNPARVIEIMGGPVIVTSGVEPCDTEYPTLDMALRAAVNQYRLYFHSNYELFTAAQEQLAGHDLMCWCPPGQPCHADVLLEEANKETLK